MVEFVIVAPILLLLVFGIVQFGIMFNNYVALTDAVRVGARQAAVSRTLPNPESADGDAGQAPRPAISTTRTSSSTVDPYDPRTAAGRGCRAAT